MIDKILPDLTATADLAQTLASQSPANCVFYLHGQLGAGKTTFSQYFIRACGYQQTIKSPTFSLLEHYLTPLGEICHIDCYRIHDPEELEYIGIRDYQQQTLRWLIEWPEQGMGYLPAADVILNFKRDHGQHSVTLIAKTVQGETLLTSLASS